MLWFAFYLRYPAPDFLEVKTNWQQVRRSCDWWTALSFFVFVSQKILHTSLHNRTNDYCGIPYESADDVFGGRRKYLCIYTNNMSLLAHPNHTILTKSTFGRMHHMNNDLLLNCRSQTLDTHDKRQGYTWINIRQWTLLFSVSFAFQQTGGDIHTFWIKHSTFSFPYNMATIFGTYHFHTTHLCRQSRE